jgi:hypothetical protein
MFFAALAHRQRLIGIDHTADVVFPPPLWTWIRYKSMQHTYMRDAPQKLVWICRAPFDVVLTIFFSKYT